MKSSGDGVNKEYDLFYYIVYLLFIIYLSLSLGL